LEVAVFASDLGQCAPQPNLPFCRRPENFNPRGER
jgi:hypothetical protein